MVDSNLMPTFAPAKQETDAPVAQLVEHLTLNQGVQSSSLCGCTKSKRDKPKAYLFFCFLFKFLSSIVIIKCIFGIAITCKFKSARRGSVYLLAKIEHSECILGVTTF